MFWWIPLAFTAGTMVSGFNDITWFVFVALLVTVATLSRADIRAMNDPEEYRRLTSLDALSSQNGYAFLLRRIAESMRS